MSPSHGKMDGYHRDGLNRFKMEFEKGYIYERVNRILYRRVFGDYSHRQRFRFLPPERKDERREFILNQYDHLMGITAKKSLEYLPIEYYDQLIELLEEIQEYEKCKDILSLKNLVK